MAQIKGEEGSITFASNAVGELRSFSVEMSQETRQVTFPTMNTPTPTIEYTAGVRTWSGTAEIYMDTNDAGFGFDEISDGSGDWGTGVSAAMVLVIADATTDATMTGSVFVTGFNINSSHDGTVEASITFQGSGDLALVKSVT
jgi:hypothetical protein